LSQAPARFNVADIDPLADLRRRNQLLVETNPEPFDPTTAELLLDIVGIFDPSGAADAASAAIAASRGDYGGAGCNLAGAGLPIFGDLAKISKWAKRVRRGVSGAPSSTRYVVNNGLPPGLPSYTLNNPNGRVSGLLIFQEGGQTRYVRLISGENNATNAGLAGARNLPGANNVNWHHVEFQALEIMRQRGITNASLLHNYPTGLPCGSCMPIRAGVRDLTRLQGSLASGSELSIFGLTPFPAGSTRSPWIVSPAGSVRVTGTR
jgi:hypothetical protein